MARASKTITIEAEGRDRGKVFRLEKLSPVALEDWIARTLLAMGKARLEIPENFRTMSGIDLITVAIDNFGKLVWSDAKLLLAEMLACVSVPDESAAGGFRAMVEDDIDELATLLQLRSEIVQLHMAGNPAAVRTITGAAPIRLKGGRLGHAH